MPSFTLPLKDVIKLTGGTTEVNSNGVTLMTGGNIGLNYYPIFEAAYRDILNGKIIDRYWNREIGAESIEMFQLSMRRKMNEIMPYYNKLYLSEKITFDPLSTIDITTVTNAVNTQEGTSTGTSEANTDATGASRTVSSETPQAQLSGNGDYATAASDVNSVSNNVSTGTQSSSESMTGENDTNSNTKGYQGVASDLIMRYRESLLNIDLMILGEIEECFMLVWDNADSFTNRRGIYPWY